MIELFMRENGIRKIGFVQADMFLPYDYFTVELQGGWLAEHIGRGATVEAALSDALSRLNARMAA